MGNPAGGLLLMLLAIFLLVEFFAGRLDWLFNLKAAVDTAATGQAPGAPSTGPSGPSPVQLSLAPGRRTTPVGTVA